ncbi:hypothetical protein Mhypo_03341 [Meiothermus hypogaeus]|nr:hypothetical protein Mhypo_03341 [Meiothermus hypogaeus]
MVRSLGLHRIEARSYWGLVARVNLILLVHNLIRSRVLLKPTFRTPPPWP